MRQKNTTVFRRNRRANAGKPLLRLASNGRLQIGYAVRNIAVALLPDAGAFKNCGDHSEIAPGLLFPGHDLRVIWKSETLKNICMGCRREVAQIIEAIIVKDGIQTNVARCQDCVGIAIEQMDQFHTAKSN